MTKNLLGREVTKKKSLFAKRIDAIYDYTTNEELNKQLRLYLEMLSNELKDREETLFLGQWQGRLNKLSEMADTDEEKIAIVKYSLDNYYLNFFMPKTNNPKAKVEKGSKDNDKLLRNIVDGYYNESRKFLDSIIKTEKNEHGKMENPLPGCWFVNNCHEAFDSKCLRDDCKLYKCMDKLISMSNIPYRFSRPYTDNNFYSKDDLPNCRTLEYVKRNIFEMVLSFTKENLCLLFGDGVGKTNWAIRIMLQFFLYHYRTYNNIPEEAKGFYISLNDLLFNLDTNMHNDRYGEVSKSIGMKYDKYIKQITTCPFLIIDDLGKRDSYTSFEVGKIGDIIQMREAKGLFTMLVGNVEVSYNGISKVIGYNLTESIIRKRNAVIIEWGR